VFLLLFIAEEYRFRMDFQWGTAAPGGVASVSKILMKFAASKGS
jgi:hypothetical protein